MSRLLSLVALGLLTLVLPLLVGSQGCPGAPGSGTDVEPQPGVYAPPPGYFSANSTLVDFDHDASGQAIPHATPMVDQYAAWGVTFSSYVVGGGSYAVAIGGGLSHANLNWGWDQISEPNSLGVGCEETPADNSGPVLVIDFVDAAFQQLPTRVGVVFTDGPQYPFSVLAFAAPGSIVDSVSIDTADTTYASTGHAEDTFVGVSSAQGISRVECTTERFQDGRVFGFEIDNLQFSPSAS